MIQAKEYARIHLNGAAKRIAEKCDGLDFVDQAAQTLGGSAATVTAKFGFSVASIFLGHIASIEVPVIAYCMLIVIDVIFGLLLSTREGTKFQARWLMTGPTRKIVLTAILFFAASVIDKTIPGEVVLYGVTGYVTSAMFIDVADKYGKLTGSSIIEWVRRKFETLAERKTP
jgi:hypothetical protein